MRKIKLFWASMLAMTAWTGVMAQTDAEYNAALAAIENGEKYHISSDVNGTAYYLTTDGHLTSVKADAGVFTITQTTGGQFKDTGFFIYGTSYSFSNPPGTTDAHLSCGYISYSDQGRATWDAQVLFLNENGKYAVRSTNASAGTSSWNYVGGAYWTVSIADVPIAQYSFDVNYIWDFTKLVSVTYELYESDGTTLVSSAAQVQEANSEVIVPASIASNYLYAYEVIGTIGSSDCTIKVVRTIKSNVVHALSDLSNDKAYEIGCDRGVFLTKDGYLASSAHINLKGASPSKFAVITYENNYYLYSVADSKFVKNNGELSDYINSVYDAVIMTPKNDPYFFWSFKIDESTTYGLNTNGNDPYGYVINNWLQTDPGNQYFMIEAADFDPTEALAALEAIFHPSYFVTYVVKDAWGNTIFTSEAEPTTLGAHITTLPSKYHRAYYTYEEKDITISEHNTAVEFTATWNGPFKLSENFANAHWYDMAMRSTWYVTSAVKDENGAYKTQNANTMGLGEDSYQWAFIGNGYDGFKIINKAEGEGKSFGWTDAQATNAGIPTVMDDAEGHHAWNIVASTNANVPAGSFCLNVPSTNLYINQFGGLGGSVKFWDSTNNLGDAGSAFSVFDVPTNFASFVVDEIAPYLEPTGYFTFTDAIKAAIDYDSAYKTECPFETYKSMKEKLAAIDMTDLNNYILPETGFYTLKNKHYGTYMGIDPSDANMYGNYAAANLPKHIVKLTKNADNTYTIGLMGKFAPAIVETSAQVTANAEAGNYTLEIPEPGFGAFNADLNTEYSTLHCDAQGKIVGWSTNALASLWQVADAESIQLEVGEAGYATAYLPFPATPAGVYDISVPEALGTWTFDDAANLTAGSGKATLALYGDGVTATDGPDASNGAVSAPVGGGFLLDTHLSEVSSAYTFMFDVSFPDVSGYNCLFQNDVNYKSNTGKDGSFFIKNGQVGFNSAGLGYKGTINTNEWHRIVVVMNDSRCTLYLDGTQIGGPTSAQDVNAWAMRDTKQFLLFIDNDGEEKVTNAAEIRFWAQALTAEEVAKLGAAGYVPQPKQSDMKVYIATLAESASGHSQYLSLDELDGTIPEATPVILKASPEKYVFAVGEKAEETVPDGALKLYDTTVDGGRALAKELAPALEENVLKGTFEPIEAAGKYVLAKPEDKDVCFYKAESGTIAAGKAYLELDSDIKAFFFDFNGEATGINDLKDIKNSQDIIFNIAGQRLNKAQKGINIVNGKKILF